MKNFGISKRHSRITYLVPASSKVAADTAVSQKQLKNEEIIPLDDKDFKGF